MAHGNAIKSIGYMDTVLFWTIGKSDIYQHKSLGTQQQIFIRVWKAGTKKPQKNISRLNSCRKKYCICISYRFHMRLQAIILFTEEKFKLLRLTAYNLLNSTSQCQHIIKIWKISAVGPEMKLFLCNQFKMSQIPRQCPFTHTCYSW